MITRRVTFRLYPTKTQTAKLFEWRRLHAYVYNSAIADRKENYQRLGKSINYLAQQNCLPAFKQTWPEYVELGSHAVQATLKRVDLAFQRFFKKLGGYPRFKSIRRYSGWTYPDNQSWKAHTTGDNGYLELSNLGSIQMRGKARTWGRPTTCTIVYRNGLWYSSITVECEPVRATSTGAVGVDFGCLTAAAMSDGTKIDNPRFLGKTQAKIRKISRQKRRRRAPNYKCKIKASKRWLKAQKRVSKLQRKAANQRQDWIHQQATKIVSSNSLVATEKLNLKGMTRKPKKALASKPGGDLQVAIAASGKRKRQKTGLNRSVLDVGMGMFRKALEYKLAEAGGVFIEVPTKTVKPSQTCPKCGHQESKTLDERVHCCAQCSYTSDRDVAAAKVMLSWALGTSVLNRGEGSSTPVPKERKHCGGLKQLALRKRHKPSARAAGGGCVVHS